MRKAIIELSMRYNLFIVDIRALYNSSAIPLRVDFGNRGTFLSVAF